MNMVTTPASVLDMIIIGAGISGIGMAVHMKRDCPGKSIAVLERRDNLGGTWDLFRYPGVRSDSDMHTLASRSSRGRTKRPSPTAPRSSIT